MSDSSGQALDASRESRLGLRVLGRGVVAGREGSEPAGNAGSRGTPFPVGSWQVSLISSVQLVTQSPDTYPEEFGCPRPILTGLFECFLDQDLLDLGDIQSIEGYE